jgi:hypothetical protein
MLRRKLTMTTILLLGLTTCTYSQNGKAHASLGRTGDRALAYFEQVKGHDFDAFLRSIRRERVSPAIKAQVISSLRKEDVVTPSAKGQAKLATLEPVLLYHDRHGVIEFRIIHVGQAFVGLYNRSLVLISEEALGLLTAEELQAAVAHELAHEYFTEEYELARKNEQFEKVQEIELRCDGVAIITLTRLGLDPTRLITGMTKLTRFNEGKGAPITAAFYSALDERVKFCRIMIQKVKGQVKEPQVLATR